ncbi:hypothetical protein J2S19_004225 [Metabacillus malikii]|uniref:Uncharacterized protein n=1 Tax=Metabacillus malikii TaxID=1504265 RepID=A0ABT9ZKT2_9BACI|nr:hypothetical protein [Metabacillus malikii]
MLNQINGGPSENLGPTVTVWMGEELRISGVLSFPFY